MHRQVGRGEILSDSGDGSTKPLLHREAKGQRTKEHAKELTPKRYLCKKPKERAKHGAKRKAEKPHAIGKEALSLFVAVPLAHLMRNFPSNFSGFFDRRSSD